jgi:glycyl-radical enzyme activating protein
MLKVIPQPEPLTVEERERLEQIEGVIFDIQRYSLHDGPGLRTNVFLKGCPLRCQWCSNPESQHVQTEFALFAHNCIACGQFVEACPIRWQQDKGSSWTKELEEAYHTRVMKCPTEAIHRIGEQRTAGEVMAEVVRDLPFYGDSGGMTLTGGEPTMQPHFTEALLRLAKAETISTAMETCGYTRWTVLERLLPYLDHILFDVKHIDTRVHQVFTGVGNELILSNLRQLVELGAPVTIRVPLIPGFNASPESLRAIAEFVLALNSSVASLDLIPYHTFGRSKYTALNRDYPWEEYQRLTDQELETLARVIESYGLTVNIGG